MNTAFHFFSDPIYMSATVILVGATSSYFFWNNTTARKNIPNLWTALGLLGTFIALSASLFLMDGIIGVEGDAIEMSESVNQLPFKLSTAFITSIIGIIAAQISNFRISRAESIELNKVDYLKESPEKLLFDLRNLAKKQNEFFKNTNNNIENILSATKEQNEFVKSTSTHMYNLLSTTHRINDSIVQTKDGLIQEFHVTMEKLKTTMHEMRDDFKEIHNSMAGNFKATMGSLKEDVKSDATAINHELANHSKEALGKYVEELNNSQALLTELQDKNSETLKHNLEALANQIGELGSTMKATLQQDSAEILKDQKEMHEQAISGMNEVSSSGISEINQMKNAILEENERFRESIQNQGIELLKNHNDLLNKLENDFGVLLTNIKELQDVTEKTVIASSSKMQEAAGLYDKQRDLQGEILTQVQNQLGVLEEQLKERKAEFDKYKYYEDQLNAMNNRISDLEDNKEELHI